MKPDISLDQIKTLRDSESPLIDLMEMPGIELLFIKVNSYQDIIEVREYFHLDKILFYKGAFKTPAYIWDFLDDHMVWPVYIGLDKVYAYKGDEVSGWNYVWETKDGMSSGGYENTLILEKEVLLNPLLILLTNIRKEYGA